MKLSLPLRPPVIGFSVMLIGLIGLIFNLYFWHVNQRAITAAPLTEPVAVMNTNQTTEQPVITGKPVRLLIQSLDIDLIVADGNYYPSSRTWTLSKDKAHYALMTSQPNTTYGNTLIYGHNTPAVFASLPGISQRSEAKVFTDNGHVFSYTYTGSSVVKPEDTEVLYYSGAPRLTLQTCTGIFDQNRQLFYFDLSSVK